MTDEIAQPSESQEVAPTLDEVISSFNVQPSEQPNTVSEPTPTQIQQTAKIDPYDENSLNSFANQTAQTQAELLQQIQALKASEDKRNQETAQAKVNADIQSAVKSITGQVEGISDEQAEFILEKKVRENKGFEAIWQNRDSNPEAYKAALDAIARESDGKFARVDPQIAENHRAAQQSQQSNNTQQTPTYGNSLEKRLAEATSEAERRQAWEQMKALS